MELFSLFATIGLKDEGFTSGIGKAQSGFSKFGSIVGGVGKAALGTITAIGAGLTAMGGFAIKAGIEWESAFAGVLKTVDGTPEQLDAIAAGLRNMAKEIPTAAADLAGIAENAGQLGIQTDNIVAFTRVMADLGEATNLTGEEAATMFARFANITGMSQDNFDRLGSAIVDLGNNFATTEAEIGAMGLRLAAAGTQIGLTEAEILGFATALSSVGIEAEAGGSAFSKVMSQIQLAVETSNEDLAQFAKVAGMSADEFSKAFQEDAAGAIVDFVAGLNDAEANGMSAIAVLDEMGITEIRMRDALLRAAGASDVFADAIETGSAAWAENTALTDEAAKRYQTLESRISMLKNRVTDLGISFKESVDGPLNEIVDTATGMLDQLAVAFEANGLAGLIGELGNVFSRVAISIADAAPGVIDGAVLLIDSFIDTIQTNLPQLLESGTRIISSLIDGIGKTLPKFATTAIEVILGLAKALLQNAPQILQVGIDTLLALVEGITQQLPSLIPVAVDAILQLVTTLLDNVDQLVDAAIDLVMGLADGLITALPVLIEKAPEIIQKLVTAIIDNAPKLIDAAIELVLALVTGIITNLPMLAQATIQIISTIIDLLVELPGKIWDAIVTGIEKVIEWASQIYDEATTRIQEVIKSVVDYLSELPEKIWNAIISAVDRFIEWAQQIYDEATTRINKMITDVISFLVQLPGKIWNAIVDAVNKVATWGQNIITEAKNKITEMINTVQRIASDAPETIWNAIKGAVDEVIRWGKDVVREAKNAIGDMIDGIKEKASAIWNTMTSIGDDLIKGFWNGINNAKDWLLGKISGFFGGVEQSIKDFFGIASPSKLMAEIGRFTAEGFVVGLESMARTVQNAANDVFGIDAPGVNASYGVDSYGSGLALAGATAGSGTVIYNTQNIQTVPMSPFELELQAVAQLEQLRWQR